MNLNICFIIPTGFGIPAINGGAVETLVDTILEENKVKGLCDISVVTSYNEAIGKTYVKENHVEYLYIKNNFLCRFPENYFLLAFHSLRSCGSRKKQF